jgi:hypothetical protein
MAYLVLEEIMYFVNGHVALDSNSVEKRLCDTYDSFWELEEIGLIEVCRSFVVEERD